MTSPNISFIPLGAILQRLQVGPHNIVLNFNTAAEYATNPAHFGATIGRIANRIHNATITSLAGQSWTLDANNGPNSLHGGHVGWGKKPWSGPETAEDGSVMFRYLSPHLDEKFPGEVEVVVKYTAEDKDGKTTLTMDYEAKLLGSTDETAVNITNHSYFNLSGQPTIAGTQAWLGSNLHLPLDDGGIPVSNDITPYPGIESQTPFVLGESEPDVDDCFVFPAAATNPGSVPLDTRGETLNTCGKFYHPDSKVHLEVSSTEPAFQFYTGKYVEIEARPDGTPARVPRAGFCVEPSRFVDAVNRESWRGQVLLKKGEVYGSRIVYSTWLGEPGSV